MPTFHLVIKGKVQGVFYRDTARKTAQKLGVTGWVKNTEDGDVEAMVSGTEKCIQEFIEWCRSGPPRASVSEVIVSERQETAFESFSVRR